VLGNDGGSDPRTRFYNKFEEEITEHDKDFDKRGGENLNITLIFVRLSFSRVDDGWTLTLCEVRSAFGNSFRVHYKHPTKA